MKVFFLIILLIIPLYSFASDVNREVTPSLLLFKSSIVDGDLSDSLTSKSISEIGCSINFLDRTPVLPTDEGMINLIKDIENIGYKIKVYSDDDDRNKEVLTLGIWTSNFTSLEFFKLDVDFLSVHELTGNIALGYDSAQAVLGYNYTIINDSNLNFGVYATYDHSFFSPESFSTGGRISYDTKLGGINLSIFTFYKHIEDFKD